MKTEKEYKLFIKNPGNWRKVSETGIIRTYELHYKNASIFRMDMLTDDGKWKRKYWYKITPAGNVIMRMPECIRFLRAVDQATAEREETK